VTPTDIVVRLLRVHPEIATLHVLEYPRVPSLQERSPLTPDDEELVAQASTLRERHRLPFWDSLLLSSFNRKSPPKSILAAARFHNGSRTTVHKIPAGEVTTLLQVNSPETTTAALSSLVRLNDGSRRHIPMLDFHCPSSAANLELATEVIRNLNATPGYLVESGKSYHFYGERLLVDSELTRFLASALLFSPIIDRAWIAHQLLEGFCGLRISGRAPFGLPKVIRQIEEP
jgi:hypothetical protein